ncbi:hypothetical protein [uncultured Marivita sp.]|uniref:hypothetical protein n=1 Tax=uncultured Marivita sp. TaxID=888080 RepID=UPI00262682CB|nr:hypothetical protein [uncultured Marivita sp.]
MSRWSDSFESHQIHETLTTLENWMEFDDIDLDAEHEVDRRRFVKVLSLIKRVIDGQDPDLSSDSLISNLNNQLRQAQIWNQIQSYSTNRKLGNLRNANEHINDLLPLIYQLASFSYEPDVAQNIRDLNKSYERFCEAVDKKSNNFEKRISSAENSVQKLEQQLSEIQSRFEALSTDIEQTLSEWQNEFTNGQTTRAEEFSAKQIERDKYFDAAVRDWRDQSEKEIDSITAEHQSLLKQRFDSFLSEIDKLLLMARTKHQDILEIHELVGTDGVAGGYKSNATQEQTAANIWRRVAMGSFIAAGFWILLKYYMGFEPNADGSFNWSEIITTMSLTLVFLGMGGYAAKQSSIHRETEQHMRWFALEVKAIDPFLSSLPEDKRNELKNELTQKLFGQNRVSNNSNSNNIELGALKVVADAFQSVLKASGKG